MYPLLSLFSYVKNILLSLYFFFLFSVKCPYFSNHGSLSWAQLWYPIWSGKKLGFLLKPGTAQNMTCKTLLVLNATCSTIELLPSLLVLGNVEARVRKWHLFASQLTSCSMLRKLPATHSPLWLCMFQRVSCSSRYLINLYWVHSSTKLSDIVMITANKIVLFN